MKKGLLITFLLITVLISIIPSAITLQGKAEDSQQTYLPVAIKHSETLTTQPVWRALLLVYHNTDVDYIDDNGVPQHLATTMPLSEMEIATWSFRQAASIANNFSNGEAFIQYDIVHITRPINSLTLIGELPLSLHGNALKYINSQPVLTPINPNNTLNSHSYWVSPSDTIEELNTYAPSGKYDSIFVHWMQCDMQTDQCIPSFGWGWGMEASGWSNNATYATVANADDWLWQLPTVGEVWLHEWLHGVSPFYQGLGYLQPQANADGGSSHGYVWSPTLGWSLYYRDLMTGQVWEPLLGAYTGIPPQAWRSRSIFSYGEGVFADYYHTDTTSSYIHTGSVTWNTPDENIILGGISSADNKIYKGISFGNTAILTGRVYVPATGIGPFDSVAIALRGGGVEYWGTLAYGTSLIERNNISIIRNEVWGSLYPINLSSGWYTVAMLVDYENSVLRMKVWHDGSNEPGWQVSRPLDDNWLAQGVGFRHYGQGSRVDDLMVIELE